MGISNLTFLGYFEWVFFESAVDPSSPEGSLPPRKGDQDEVHQSRDEEQDGRDGAGRDQAVQRVLGAEEAAVGQRGEEARAGGPGDAGMKLLYSYSPT